MFWTYFVRQLPKEALQLDNSDRWRLRENIVWIKFRKYLPVQMELGCISWVKRRSKAFHDMLLQYKRHQSCVSILVEQSQQSIMTCTHCVCTVHICMHRKLQKAPPKNERHKIENVQSGNFNSNVARRKWNRENRKNGTFLTDAKFRF